MSTQYEWYKCYGLRVYVNEFGVEKKMHGKAPEKAKMVDWAKEQVALTEVRVIAKYTNLLCQPNVIGTLIKMSKPRVLLLPSIGREKHLAKLRSRLRKEYVDPRYYCDDEDLPPYLDCLQVPYNQGIPTAGQV